MLSGPCFQKWGGADAPTQTPGLQGPLSRGTSHFPIDWCWTGAAWAPGLGRVERPRLLLPGPGSGPGPVPLEALEARAQASAGVTPNRGGRTHLSPTLSSGEACSGSLGPGLRPPTLLLAPAPSDLAWPEGMGARGKQPGAPGHALTDLPLEWGAKDWGRHWGPGQQWPCSFPQGAPRLDAASPRGWIVASLAPGSEDLWAAQANLALPPHTRLPSHTQAWGLPGPDPLVAWLPVLQYPSLRGCLTIYLFTMNCGVGGIGESWGAIPSRRGLGSPSRTMVAGVPSSARRGPGSGLRGRGSRLSAGTGRRPPCTGRSRGRRAAARTSAGLE